MLSRCKALFFLVATYVIWQALTFFALGDDEKNTLCMNICKECQDAVRKTYDKGCLVEKGFYATCGATSVCQFTPTSVGIIGTNKKVAYARCCCRMHSLSVLLLRIAKPQYLGVAIGCVRLLALMELNKACVNVNPLKPTLLNLANCVM